MITNSVISGKPFTKFSDFVNFFLQSLMMNGVILMFGDPCKPFAMFSDVMDDF